MTTKKLLDKEWERLKKALSSKNWDAGQEATYFGFFCHGWYGRLNEASYQANNSINLIYKQTKE
jgi:hypothetical protein